LRTLSPRSTLERGYAIVRARGEIVRSAGAVKAGDRLEVEVADGRLGAKVE
jgi:exodeoxyribonuclease VII large subunit